MSTRGQPRFQAGRVIRARSLNTIAKGAGIASQRLPGPRQIDLSDDGPQESATEGGSGEVKIFTVASEQANTVTASDSTVIQKPANLRGSVSTRTDSSIGLEQSIEPAYVSGTDSPTTTTEVVAALVGGVYYDLNTAGRNWWPKIEMRTFTVASEQTDTVTATTGEVIAKPTPLRGFVAARVVGSENQVMLPPYISAAGFTRDSSVTAVKVGTVASGEGSAQWLDINAQGRAWAEYTP